MDSELKWLAENVFEWKSGYDYLAKRVDGHGSKFETVENANYEQHNDFYGKRFSLGQWKAARAELGLDQPEVTDSEEEEWQRMDKEGAVKVVQHGHKVDSSFFWKEKQYSAYFKDVRHIDTLDVYRVVSLFDCEKHGHPISHAAKKLLLSGSRTGGKHVEEDVREAIDSLHRWLEMREEDRNAL